MKNSKPIRALAKTSILGLGQTPTAQASTDLTQAEVNNIRENGLTAPDFQIPEPTPEFTEDEIRNLRESGLTEDNGVLRVQVVPRQNTLSELQALVITDEESGELCKPTDVNNCIVQLNSPARGGIVVFSTNKLATIHYENPESWPIYIPAGVGTVIFSGDSTSGNFPSYDPYEFGYDDNSPDPLLIAGSILGSLNIGDEITILNGSSTHIRFITGLDHSDSMPVPIMNTILPFTGKKLILTKKYHEVNGVYDAAMTVVEFPFNYIAEPAV